MIYDALIAGGGVSGGALAIDLARAGRNVVVIERESGPHDKVCGEFLSFEAEHYLARLGVSPVALGAVPIGTVQLVRGHRPVSARLPFQALSLSRRVLDEALLQLAIKEGAEVRRGVRVKALAKKNGQWQAETDQGHPITARSAFLATGKHDLKDLKRGPGTQGDLLGFKMYFELIPSEARELDGHVELALFRGGYAGLEPVEGGRANLCLLVRRRDFLQAQNSWDELLAQITAACPHLDKRLSGARATLTKPLAISAIPYGFLFRDEAECSHGLWRLGDQAAVIPSFSGDGMSIALHSARLASKMYLNGGTAQRYHSRLRSDVGRQIARATRVSRALVTPWGQLGASAIANLAPTVLIHIAQLTRIPQAALAAAGVQTTPPPNSRSQARTA